MSVHNEIRTLPPRCHGESGIPELLYPHTKFPSECCTPVHDSLVDPVRGYNIRIVDYVSRHVSPSGYSIPLPSFVKSDDSAWWVLQHCEEDGMTALDGCFSTAGLGAEWYKWACTIAIRLFTVHEKWKKRRQNRARMRSSWTKPNTGGRMVSCTGCGECYNEECMPVPKQVWRKIIQK